MCHKSNILSFHRIITLPTIIQTNHVCRNTIRTSNIFNSKTTRIKHLSLIVSNHSRLKRCTTRKNPCLMCFTETLMLSVKTLRQVLSLFSGQRTWILNNTILCSSLTKETSCKTLKTNSKSNVFFQRVNRRSTTQITRHQNRTRNV